MTAKPDHAAAAPQTPYGSRPYCRADHGHAAAGERLARVRLEGVTTR